MSMPTSDETVSLPKGTIVKLRGFPCELTHETTVISDAIKKIGLENLESFLSSSPIETAPTLQPQNAG